MSLLEKLNYEVNCEVKEIKIQNLVIKVTQFLNQKSSTYLNLDSDFLCFAASNI